MPRLTSYTHRILSDLVGRPVEPSEIVTVDVDRIMAHDGSGPVIAKTLAKHGIEALRAADRAIFVFDHFFPATNEREAALHAEARRFCARHGIPIIAGEGIAHQVVSERGLFSPGTVFVGADSHTSSGGAFGAFATGLGATDVAAVLATGRLWIEVPETLRIRLVGRLRPGVSGQDLILAIMGRVGTSGALEKSIEFVGPAIGGLSMSARFKLSNHAVEMGAVAGIIGVDAACRSWLEARRAKLDHADRVIHDDAGFGANIEIDLDTIEPLVALPSKPDRVQSLEAVERVAVDQVFIGSCAGGRLDDLQAAARVLKGRRVHAGVRLLVGPASTEVLRAAMQDGTLSALVEAGATVLPPGCGACLGRLGTLADGEVSVATQNRNFVGRAGSKSSKLYLASPETAAQVALSGYLAARAVEDQR